MADLCRIGTGSYSSCTGNYARNCVPWITFLCQAPAQDLSSLPRHYLSCQMGKVPRPLQPASHNSPGCSTRTEHTPFFWRVAVESNLHHQQIPTSPGRVFFHPGKSRTGQILLQVFLKSQSVPSATITPLVHGPLKTQHCLQLLREATTKTPNHLSRDPIMQIWQDSLNFLF